MNNVGMYIRGRLRWGHYDTTGQIFLGLSDTILNATNLAITVGEPTKINRIGAKPEDDGQVIGEITRTGIPTIAITNDELPGDALALHLQGDYSTLNVASGTFSDESVIARHDKWVLLPQRNIVQTPTPSDSVTATDTTPYARDTDYVIDYRNGLIKALSSGAIDDGEQILVSAGYGAIVDGYRVGGSTNGGSLVRLLYDGVNKDTGNDALIIVPKISLAANGDFSPVSQEFASGVLSGTPQRLPNETAPYYIEDHGVQN